MATQRIGTVEAELLLEIADFVRNANKVKNETSKLGKTFDNFSNKAQGFLAGGIAAIGAFAVAAAKASSDVEETLNVINEGFGENTQAVLRWSEEIGDAVGRSQFQIREMVGSLQAMLAPMIGSAEQAEILSKEMTKLAVDLGSFFNATDDEALIALKSALSGQSEPLRRFGVVMTEASLNAFLLEKGIKATTKTMTEQQKVAVRAAFILEKTETAQGDAARTSDSLANSFKRLTGIFNELLVLAGESGIKLVAAETVKTLIVATQTAKDLLRFMTGVNEEVAKFSPDVQDFVTGTEAEIVKLERDLKRLQLIAEGPVFFRDELEGKIAKVTQRLEEARADLASAFQQGQAELASQRNKEEKDVNATLKERLALIDQEATKAGQVAAAEKERAAALKDTQKSIESLSKDLENALKVETNPFEGLAIETVQGNIATLEFALTNARDRLKELGEELKAAVKAENADAIDRITQEFNELETSAKANTESLIQARDALTSLQLEAKNQEQQAMRAAENTRREFVAVAGSISNAFAQAASATIRGAKDAERAILDLVRFILAQLKRVAQARLVQQGGFGGLLAAGGLELFGGLFGFARGGMVSGRGGVDNVPIMATAGEAVLSKDVTSLLRQTLNMPRAMNDPFSFNSGGIVPSLGSGGGASTGGELQVNFNTLALAPGAITQRWFRDVFIPAYDRYKSKQV